MYYLNDKHPEYEYAIYKRVRKGCPYIAKTFTNIYDVEEWINAVKKEHDKYHYTYYIDAEKYENQYPLEFAQFYYKILKRQVNDWQEIA